MIVNGRKMPVCTDSVDFSKDTDDSVGYVYKWTYKGPVKKVIGKYYIGRRLKRGEIEDYNHSGTHNQFNHYFNLPESKFHYEILHSSDEWVNVKNKEADLLEKCVGIDPDCWNLHKPTKELEDNDEQLDLIFDRIQNSIIKRKKKDGSQYYNGHYEVETIKYSELSDVEFYQTRDQDVIPKHRQTITNKINMAGSIVNTDPIITLQDRDPSELLEHEGGDISIDGNHTYLGIGKSKHRKYVKRILIPYEDHKFLTDLDIDALTGYLNGGPDEVEEPNNLQKGVDYCVNEYEANNNYKSKRVKERLLKMKFDDKQVGKIIRMAKKEIARRIQNKKQKGILITYGEGSSVDMKHPRIKDFMRKYDNIDRGGTKMAFVIRSGSPILDRFLYEVLELEEKWFNDDTETREQVSKITVGITHSEPYTKQQWDYNPKLKQKFERISDWLDDRGLEVQIVYKEVQPVFRSKTQKI